MAKYMEFLPEVVNADLEQLRIKDRQYAGSWQKRGGIGAFMMAARKWDRLEEQVKKHGYDIFVAAADDPRPEGIRDDIGDLRRYLLLIEGELVARDQAIPDHQQGPLRKTPS